MVLLGIGKIHMVPGEWHNGTAYGSRTHDTGMKALGLNRLSNAAYGVVLYTALYYLAAHPTGLSTVACKQQLKSCSDKTAISDN